MILWLWLNQGLEKREIIRGERKISCFLYQNFSRPRWSDAEKNPMALCETLCEKLWRPRMLIDWKISWFRANITKTIEGPCSLVCENIHVFCTPNNQWPCILSLKITHCPVPVRWSYCEFPVETLDGTLLCISVYLSYFICVFFCELSLTSFVAVAICP